MKHDQVLPWVPGDRPTQAMRGISAKLLLSTAAVFLTACSGKPSDSEIETQVVAQLVDNEVRQLASIESFTKTNGFEKDANTYVADIKYKVVFKKSLQDLAREAQQAAANNASTGDASLDKAFSGAQGMINGLAMLAIQAKFGDFKRGDSLERTDRLAFIKTEKGWMLTTKPAGILE